MENLREVGVTNVDAASGAARSRNSGLQPPAGMLQHMPFYELWRGGCARWRRITMALTDVGHGRRGLPTDTDA
jgi:hypothetical protein